jgi:lipopolysaccharide export system protein LptA
MVDRRRQVVVLAAAGAFAWPALGVSKGAPSAPPLPSLAPFPVRPPDQPAATPKADDDTVTYETGPSQYIDKEHRWHMTGGVTFHQGDAVLETQAATVDMDQDQDARDARSQSPVHLYNPQDDLTGEHGFIDFTTHIATLTDHITLIAKPSKPSGTGAGSAPNDSAHTALKTPATVTCDEIVYNYRSKIGHIPGKVTVYQSDRTLTADSGDYDGYRKMVVLNGHVHEADKDGSVVDTPELQVGVETGNEWIYIPHTTTGRWHVKKSQGDEDKNAPTPEPPPALPPVTPQPDPSNSTPAPSTSGASSAPPATAAPPVTGTKP